MSIFMDGHGIFLISLLPGLLPTAAVAANSPLQSQSLHSAHGESRAGSCSLSTDGKLSQSLCRHLSLCCFCPLECVPCDKNMITYLVPLWCDGCSQGAICHAAGWAGNSHSREKGKYSWELLPVKVAVKVLLALVIGNSHLQGQGVWVHVLAKNFIHDCALLFPLLHVGMDGPSRTEPSQTWDMQHWLGVDVRACPGCTEPNTEL